jgi:4-hydroxy-tetrahydrodipicolinate reductase
MGRMITRAIAETKGFRLVAASDHPSSPHIGADSGLFNGLNETGVVIADSPEVLTKASADVLIDFTTAEASLTHATLAAEAALPIVIGTTGHDQAQSDALKKSATKNTVVWCANTSVGVTLLTQTVEEIVRALGDDWDIEIAETHHRHKIDAPSGTALALGHAAARGRGVALEDVAVWARHGTTRERNDGAIGFAVMRGGDVVGEHSVMIYGRSERIELTHRATDRMIFAHGALRAARWAAEHGNPGLYTMHDVL